MAVTLSITVTNAQAARVQTAMGHFDTSVPPVWVNATAAEIQAMIKAWAKSKAIDYETTQNAIADRDTKSAEVW